MFIFDGFGIQYHSEEENADNDYKQKYQIPRGDPTIKVF